VDYLEHRIKLFLTTLSRSALTDDQAARELELIAFTSGDVELARKLLRHKVKIAKMAQDLTEAHTQRLHQGLRESLETSSIHLNLLSNLKRINSQLSNIAHPILVRGGQGEA
jgi:phosphate:Na+ symporter